MHLGAIGAETLLKWCCRGPKTSAKTCKTEIVQLQRKQTEQHEEIQISEVMSKLQYQIQIGRYNSKVPTTDSDTKSESDAKCSTLIEQGAPEAHAEDRQNTGPRTKGRNIGRQTDR